MAEHFKAAQPVEYLRKFLEKDVRPDGRELGEFRSTSINIGSINTARGSAVVKIGNTKVVCGVQAELATPSLETPGEGFIVPNVDLSAACVPTLRPGPPGDIAQATSQFMVDVIKSSRCLNPSDLCIAKGKLCWVVYCDLICLDYDGNLPDACILSLIAALRNTTLSTVRWNEETEKPETDPVETHALNLRSTPSSTSLVIFDDHVLLVDATKEEEEASTGVITIVTVGKNVCLLHKPGGSPLTDDQMMTAIERAIEREEEVLALLRNDTAQTRT